MQDHRHLMNETQKEIQISQHSLVRIRGQIFLPIIVMVIHFVMYNQIPILNYHKILGKGLLRVLQIKVRLQVILPQLHLDAPRRQILCLLVS